jgi:hypothetical protein
MITTPAFMHMHKKMLLFASMIPSITHLQKGGA